MNAWREETAQSNYFHDSRYRIWKRKPGKKKTSNPKLQFFFLFLSLAPFSLKTSEKFPTRGQPSSSLACSIFFSQLLALCFQVSRVPTLSLKLPLTSLSTFQIFIFFPKKTQSSFSAPPSCHSKPVFPLQISPSETPKENLPPLLSALVPL